MRLYILAGLLALTSAATINIEDFFKLDPGGSCSGKETLLGQFASESKELVSVASKNFASQPWYTSKSTSQYLYNFFKINSNNGMPTQQDSNAFTQVQNVFKRYLDFYSTTGSVIPPIAEGQPGPKPYLFCNDNNLKLKVASDPAKSTTGSTITDPRTGKAMTLGDTYPVPFGADPQRGRMNVAVEINLDGSLDSKGNVQYNIVYLFIQRANPNNGFCTGEGRGQTFPARGPTPRTQDLPESFIILCPAGLTYGQTPTLGGVDPVLNPIQTIDQVMPYSVTFTHELFHYLGWYPASSNYKILDPAYDLAQMIKLPQAKAITNAQSYVFFALGLWYSDNREIKVGNDVTPITYAINGECMKLEVTKP